MNIETHVEDQTLLASLQGRLDTVTTPQVGETINEALKNCSSCILDMENVDYVSSAGLRFLLLLHKNMAAGGGKLVLLHVQPGVLDILQMTGFSSFLVME